MFQNSIHYAPIMLNEVNSSFSPTLFHKSYMFLNSSKVLVGAFKEFLKVAKFSLGVI